jgi:hypothetical protein
VNENGESQKHEHSREDEMRRCGTCEMAATSSNRKRCRDGKELSHATSEVEKKTEGTAIALVAAKIVVGLDVGDRKSHYCRLDQEGVV